MSKDKEIVKAEQSKVKKKSRAQETWRRFKKNKLAVFGMILFFIILLVTILADVIVSYDVSVTQVASERLQGPSASMAGISLRVLCMEHVILCLWDLARLLSA